MTRIEMMALAIKDAREFCSKYSVAPFGDTYSEFRQKTVEMFFHQICNENKETCEGCIHKVERRADIKQECYQCSRAYIDMFETKNSDGQNK